MGKKIFARNTIFFIYFLTFITESICEIFVKSPVELVTQFKGMSKHI